MLGPRNETILLRVDLDWHVKKLAQRRRNVTLRIWRDVVCLLPSKASRCPRLRFGPQRSGAAWARS